MLIFFIFAALSSKMVSCLWHFFPYAGQFSPALGMRKPQYEQGTATTTLATLAVAFFSHIFELLIHISSWVASCRNFDKVHDFFPNKSFVRCCQHQVFHDPIISIIKLAIICSSSEMSIVSIGALSLIRCHSIKDKPAVMLVFLCRKMRIHFLP